MRKPIVLLIVILLVFTSCSSPPPPTIEYGIFSDEDLIGSVKQDTSCFQGPDPRFGIAAELDQDLQISIIGASSGGKYAVISNPTNSSVLCWVKTEIIDIKSADLLKAFEMVSIIHPDVGDEGLSDQDLLAAFMRLNVSNPNDHGGFVEVPVIHKYSCPKEKDKPDRTEEEATAVAATATAAAATIAAEEAQAEEDALAQAAHMGCSNLFLPGMCHSSETIDQLNSECGELVYPVFYFPKEDCSSILGCATSTPPPVVFIPCTPVPSLHAPVILNLTPCWNGPGPGYEAISSVEENTVVEVLGTGVDGDHIVITNPRYDRPCWVNETDIELNGLDLTGLPIFGIPEQDSSSDSRNSQEIGCLVSSSPSVAPKCIVPCPDPVAYPLTCEP